MGDQIIAGLVVAAILGAVGLLWKNGGPALRRLRARMGKGRLLIKGAALEEIFGAMGQSNLVNLMHATPGQSTAFVEVETPDGRSVWSLDVPLGYKVSDLALAARSHFRLNGRFYRLRNKARQMFPLPEDRIEDCASDGDRLALVELEEGVWGWGRGQKRGWLRALADRVLRVPVIDQIGARERRKKGPE